MRTIYIVSEDNHGDLAVTLSYEDAINFLLIDKWISREDEAFFKRMCPQEFNEYMENSNDAFIKITKISETSHNIFRIR